jgi:hypothetical protein
LAGQVRLGSCKCVFNVDGQSICVYSVKAIEPKNRKPKHLLYSHLRRCGKSVEL